MLRRSAKRRFAAVMVFAVVVLACHRGWAATTHGSGYSAEALSSYRQAVELNPALVAQIEDRDLAGLLGQMFLADGVQHMDAGNLPEAERLLLLAGNFLETPDLYLALARCYYRQERWKASLVVFGKALEKSPSSPVIKAEMARAYVKADRRDLALKLFAEALALDADTSTLIETDELRQTVVATLVTEARDLADRDRHVEAASRMKAALRLAPTPELYLEIGEVYVKARNQQDAARAFALAVEERPALERRIQNTAVRTATARELFDRAVARHQAEDADGARRLFELSFKLDETGSTAYNIADCAVRQKRIDDAVTFYRRAISLNPDLADAYVNLAVVYMDRKLTQQAVDTLRTLVGRKPDAGAGHDLLGKALCTLGQRSEAAAAYRAAVEYNPSLASALTLVDIRAAASRSLYDDAVEHYKESRFAEALTCLKASAALRPDASQAFLEGNVQYALGDLTAARTAYERAAKIEPRKPEIHNNIGNLLLKMGRYDEAMASFQKAVEMDPTYAQGYNNLGICLRKKGLLREAIGAYRKALTIKPDYAAAHFNLGNALSAQDGAPVAN